MLRLRFFRTLRARPAARLRLVSPDDAELQRVYWTTATEVRALLHDGRAARRPAA